MMRSRCASNRATAAGYGEANPDIGRLRQGHAGISLMIGGRTVPDPPLVTSYCQQGRHGG